MNTITHALLPVILASVVERVDRGDKRKNIFSNRQILIIGLLGAAPDLLNPHLSLAARYTSWSHGFPFLVGLTIAMVLCSFFSGSRFPRRLAIWCSLAYFAHLICDLVAGGIAWLYPFRPDVIGKYWVPPLYWAWIDAACILIVYGLWRVAPHFARKKA